MVEEFRFRSQQKAFFCLEAGISLTVTDGKRVSQEAVRAQWPFIKSTYEGRSCALLKFS